MLTENSITKLNILVQSLYGEEPYDNLLTSLYNFENNYINKVLSYTHLKVNELISLIKNRIKKNNRYMISEMRSLAINLYDIINQLKSFFKKENIILIINQKYEELLVYIVNMSKNFGRDAYFDDGYVIPSLVLDETVLFLKTNNSFDNIKYIVFGADRT